MTKFAFFALLATLFLVFAISPGIAQKITAEEVISRHLDAIASSEKRAALKSFIAVGEVKVDFVTQKNQKASGRIVMASDGPKMFFGMSLNAADYPQEKFIFNGERSSVDFVRPGVRSVLGNFVQSNGVLIGQGLLGGTLSTAWALLNTENRKAKISYGGTDKIDGRQVYVLNFSPKGGSDLNISLFFDAETFNHVRTEYKRTASASIGRNIDDSARQSESRIKLSENFSEFQVYQGMNIPHKYSLSYSITGANGTTEIVWSAEFLEFAINQTLDPATFSIGK